MTTTTAFETEKITKVIGKDTYLFSLTNLSCWIYRLTKKARWGMKLEARFMFKSKDELAEKIDNFSKRVIEIQNYKEARRLKNLADNKRMRDEAINNVKVWDVFKSSYGYDMTINEFYQVTDIKGKKVTVRRIWTKTTYWDDWFTGNQKPVLNKFIGDAESYIISPCGWIKVSDYRHAFKCNPDSEHYFNYLD